MQKKLVFLFSLVLISFMFSSFDYKKEHLEYFLKDDIHVVRVKADYFAQNADVYVSNNLETVKEVAEQINPKFIVNAGFFDPVGEGTISYVTRNSEVLLNPKYNENLIKNKELMPYLDKILNRAEFRVLKAAKGLFLDVSSHFPPPESPYITKLAIQAGPLLLPEMNLEREFFVKKQNGEVVRESANALKPDARTAIGFNKEFVYVVLVPEKEGKTLKELACFMKKLGAEQAMAFDGGSSSSMCINTKNGFNCINYNDDAGFRKVKSFLYIK